MEYTGRNITYHLFTKGGWYVPLEHVGCSPTAISIMTAQSAPRSLQLPAVAYLPPPCHVSPCVQLVSYPARPVAVVRPCALCCPGADFFITVINQKTTTIMLTVAAVYLFIFLFFSIWWYLVVRSVFVLAWAAIAMSVAT